MKIAINSLVLDDRPGGVGNYAYNLINSLITSTENKHELNIFLQENVIQRFSKFNSLTTLKKEPVFKKNFHRILYEQTVMPFKYKSGSYDFIHLMDYQVPFIRVNQNFVVTIHDLTYFLFERIFTKGQQAFKQANTKYAIKHAKAIITNSNTTKNDIMRLFPKTRTDKIIVTPLAVNSIYHNEINLQDILTVRKKYQINSDYLLYTGTIEPRKNIITLIEGFSEVIKHKGDLQLVLAGKRGWMFKEIFNKIKQKGLEKNVIFTEYVPDSMLPALYKGAKVFVFPSLYEGFGLPPLEAMTCGTPVIASNTSSLPEVVGEGGILINPSNVNELIQNILMILFDETKRQDLICKGMKRAALFSWEKTMQETLKAYEKVGCEIK